MNEFLLISFLSIQVVLFTLDLRDRYLDRATQHGHERLRFGTVGFLLVVTLVFFVLQYLGLMLVPNVHDTFTTVQDLLGRGLKQPHSQQTLEGLPLFLVAILAYYIGGLWDYLVHRFVSHNRWFWFTHEYHHLPNQVFLAMPGIFVRPFVAFPAVLASFATALSIYAVFLLFGSPLWELTSIFPVLFAIGLVGTASHSCFLRQWRSVHHVIKCFGLTTPQEHVLHHTVDMDGNYGNFTTVWDRVFGTYLDPMREGKHGRLLGLPYDQDFLGTLTFGRFKLPATMRTRFQLARYCNLNGSNPLGENRQNKLDSN